MIFACLWIQSYLTTTTSRVSDLMFVSSVSEVKAPKVSSLRDANVTQLAIKDMGVTIRSFRGMPLMRPLTNLFLDHLLCWRPKFHGDVSVYRMGGGVGTGG